VSASPTTRRPDDGGGARRRPRLVAAVGFTLAGVAVLLGLMTWQIRRLAWKQALIATLAERLAAPPVALPDPLDPARDEFRRVALEGRFPGAPGAHGFPDAAYLTTMRPEGAGYRLVQPFDTADGRRVLVDRGYLPVAEKNEGGRAARPTPAPDGPVALVGALRWPQAADWFADAGAGPADNVWLSRDVARLAPLWGAEPVLVVAETPTAAAGPWPRPAPVTVDLPNDHLGYAVTWGLLAAVWAAMGGLLIRRMAARA
jgi:surfeit locus 1 family protein